VNEPVDIETGENLPPEVLRQWLTGAPWANRVFVLTDRGLYWGGKSNQYPPPEGKLHNWWTFKGVTEILKNGMT